MVPPAASQNFMVRIGRMRFPPAIKLYRMASSSPLSVKYSAKRASTMARAISIS